MTGVNFLENLEIQTQTQQTHVMSCLDLTLDFNNLFDKSRSRSIDLVISSESILDLYNRLDSKKKNPALILAKAKQGTQP